MGRTPSTLYHIPVLSKSLDVLEKLQTCGRAMTLEELHRETGVSKTTVYRILQTYVHRGYLVRTLDGQYRHICEPRKYRFAFAGAVRERDHLGLLCESLAAAAPNVGIELTIHDHGCDIASNLDTIQHLIDQRVDLVIQAQLDQAIAPIIGDRLARAGIPLVSVGIPHPHGLYVGLDNYRAGSIVGQLLAQQARELSNTKNLYALGLDVSHSTLLTEGRVSGALDALRSALPGILTDRRKVDPLSDIQAAREIISQLMKQTGPRSRVLIAAANEQIAIAASAAVRSLRMIGRVSIVSFGLSGQIIDEMLSTMSSIIGTITPDHQKHGTAVFSLGIALLKGQITSPYTFVEHRVWTVDALRDQLASVQPSASRITGHNVGNSAAA
jgi:ribose transport system substrate-binding protein